MAFGLEQAQLKLDVIGATITGVYYVLDVHKALVPEPEIWQFLGVPLLLNFYY